MKNIINTKFNFIVDTKLIEENRSDVIVHVLKNKKIKYIVRTDDFEKNDQEISIIFTHKKNIKIFSKLKNYIIVCDSNESHETGLGEKINFNSFEEINLFLEKITIIERRTKLQLIVRESEAFYDKMKMNLTALTESSVSMSEVKKDLESLFDLEVLLLQDEQLSNWNNYFKIFIKKNPKIQMMGIFQSRDLLVEENILEDGILIFSLPFNDLFLALKFKNIDSPGQTLIIELVLALILRVIEIQDQQLIKNDGEIDFWKILFSKILTHFSKNVVVREFFTTVNRSIKSGAYNCASIPPVGPAKIYLLHRSTSTGVEEAGLEDDTLVYTGTRGVDDEVPV